MTVLDRYIETTETNNQQTQINIDDLKKQIADLEQQLRVSQQLEQAQKTANREVKAWLDQGRKLMADLCSIFPSEAITELGTEVVAIAAEVNSQYDQYSSSDRFLHGSDDEPITETTPTPDRAIAESLPAPDDNTIPLSPTQVEIIITGKSPLIVDFLKERLEISGQVRKLSTLAQKIADGGITHQRIANLIRAAELTLEVEAPTLPPSPTQIAA